MAYQGFGITSGPTFRPNSSQPTFGGPFARPPSGSPSPPPPSSPPTPASPYVVPPQRSPSRKVEAPERMRSPPLALQNFHSVAGLPYSSAATYRPSDPRWYNEQKGPMNYNNAQTLQRPSALTQFSASPNFGPSVPSKIPQAQDLKRIRSPGKNSGNISQDLNGRPSDPRWDNEQKGPMNFNNAQTLQRPSALTQFSALRNFGPNVPSKIPQALDLKRTRSPGNNSGNISQDVNGRPLSSHAWVSRPRSPCDYSDLLTSQDLSSVSPFGDPYESQRKIRTEHADVQLLKRTRSPPLPSSANSVHKENSHIARNAIKRPSMSPPTSVTGSNSQSHTPGSEIRQSFLPSMHNGDAEAAETKPTSFPASKRSRSPPVPSADQVFQGISNSAQDEQNENRKPRLSDWPASRLNLANLHQAVLIS